MPLEDGFETQVVDLVGETQVMDLGGDTQVVNLFGETQVLDDANCVEYVETQLLDVFDDEDVSEIDGQGSDSTEVLGDTDDISDDELGTNDGAKSEDKGNGQCTSVSKYSEKELMEQPKALSTEQNNSGWYFILFL